MKPAIKIVSAKPRDPSTLWIGKSGRTYRTLVAAKIDKAQNAYPKPTSGFGDLYMPAQKPPESYLQVANTPNTNNMIHDPITLETNNNYPGNLTMADENLGGNTPRIMTGNDYVAPPQPPMVFDGNGYVPDPNAIYDPVNNIYTVDVKPNPNFFGDTTMINPPKPPQPPMIFDGNGYVPDPNAIYDPVHNIYIIKQTAVIPVDTGTGTGTTTGTGAGTGTGIPPVTPVQTVVAPVTSNKTLYYVIGAALAIAILIKLFK